LTRWLWDSYGAGSNAVLFWLWHPRDYGTESGEWGLVSADGTPSVRLPAVKAVADVVNRNPSLAQTHPQSAPVAILYNSPAIVLNNFDGRKQNRQDDVTDALFGCYLALLRAHIPTEFIDLDQLKRGDANRFAMLYAPDSYVLDDDSLAALTTYVKQGGTLWADGLTAWKKPNSQTRPTIPGGLTELFGAEATDIYSTQAGMPYSVTPQNELGGELWRLPLQLKGADALLRDTDGNPFAIKHHFGKGQTYYFSSAVSIAYAHRGHPLVQKWIVEPAQSLTATLPVQFISGSEKVIFRGLVGPQYKYAVLSNWGDSQPVTVSFSGDVKVTNMTAAGVSLHSEVRQGRTFVSLPLNAATSVVLQATPRQP